MDENDLEAQHIEMNRKKWDSWAPNFDNKRFSLFRYWQWRIVNTAKLQSNQNFLDIGCGTGWAVCYASKFLTEGGKAFGLDLSTKMIEKARLNGHSIPNVEFFEGNSESMPFENESIDKIICTNSFHHYLHPVIALSEIYRILRPGGRIHIVDVGKVTLFMSLMNAIAKKVEPEHVNLYSIKEMKKMFQEANLTYVGTKFIFFELAFIAEKQIEKT